ncbi:glycosyltransferase [Mucisphaera calidilacus]|uniref:Chondroitin synthase n=1 Tax=Mucisphaera calidilacus TaxID=2527982 RepID=A0A518BZF5_9BACT|nr:glycosyltransferase [Mucisphaera calidilacus]QDU72348.1 Chondroitin synthase [Mucisphaera calidilacus]
MGEVASETEQLPRVSLVMALYNQRAFVTEALDSILKQTFTDWELVIWDDGSTDGSDEIARSYAQRDPRIRYERSENRGMYFALASSIPLTSGPLIGWVDSDDRIRPTCLEKTVGLLDARPDVGMVYTDHQMYDEQGRDLGLGQRCSIPYSANRLLRDFMTFHFRLIRREVFERAGGIDTSFAFAEDYDLCMRISEIATIEHLAEVLYDYRVHTRSMSQATRLLQIEGSATAVRRALRRRGLEDQYDLTVELIPRFHIRKR